MENSNYKDRLVDDLVELYLKTFKAVQLVGPKWCGKTWTSLKHGKSLSSLSDNNTKRIALLNPDFILSGETPHVIDEWQLVPEIFDSVRNECDRRITNGNFILTSSTSLISKEDVDKINHTGTGRIAKLNMYTMSTYELGESSDLISLMDMYEGKEINKINEPFSLKDIARLIINGGWPANVYNNKEINSLTAKNYIESVINNDINEKNNYESFKFDEARMSMIIKSLAKNESSYASNPTILRDAFEVNDENEKKLSLNTLLRYLNILDKLYITNNTQPFSVNYRSSARIAKSVKRRFVDPSLAAAALGMTYEKLLKDLNTFGLLFESLVVRDLNIYMSYYMGKTYAFRDNVSGDEVDAIVEFKDGEYGAIEIKLGQDSIDDAIKSLKKFKDNAKRKPKFCCVIVGLGYGLTRDVKTGTYIVPFNALGMHFNKHQSN